MQIRSSHFGPTSSHSLAYSVNLIQVHVRESMGYNVGWFKRSNLLSFKGDRNPNNKYVSLERALKTMNFDTSVSNVGLKMRKLWAFKEINMADI